MHFFFMLKLFNVGTSQASEDVPVDISQVVSGRGISIVREVGAATAFAGKMLPTTAIGQATNRPQPHPLNLIQQGIIEERCKLRRSACHSVIPETCRVFRRTREAEFSKPCRPPNLSGNPGRLSRKLQFRTLPNPCRALYGRRESLLWMGQSRISAGRNNVQFREGQAPVNPCVSALQWLGRSLALPS